LVRKDILWDWGPKLSKGARTVDGVLWISLSLGGEVYNIGGYYVATETSVYKHQTPRQWESLVENVKINIPEGITVLVGDFNSRIGEVSSMVGGRLWLRKNVDKKVKPQGREMIRTWDSAGIIPLSGLRWKSRGEWRELDSGWTFTNKNGQSNIDHVGMRSEDLHRVKDVDVYRDMAACEYESPSGETAVVGEEGNSEGGWRK